MDREYVIYLLNCALSSKGETRETAEKNIKQLIQDNFGTLLTMFLEIMTDLNLPNTTRTICSIIAKNCIHSKNSRTQEGYENLWMSNSLEFRQIFIKKLQMSLNFKEKSILQNISKIFGSIIRIELMHKSEIPFFDTFIEMLSYNEFCYGVLETVSSAIYQLFEETNYNFELFPENNIKIFKIGIHFLGKNNIDRDIKIAHLKCILNTIDLYIDIISLSSQRIAFLKNISGFDITDDEITELSLDIFNRFFECFSDHKTSSSPEDHDYIDFICNFYNSSFNLTNEIPLQFFEFWTMFYKSNVCQLMEKYFADLVWKLILCIGKESVLDTEATSHKAACQLLILFRKENLISWNFNEELQAFVKQRLLSKNTTDNAIGCTTLGCVYDSTGYEFFNEHQAFIIHFLEVPEVANEALFAISSVVVTGDFSNEDKLLEVINKCNLLIEGRGDSIHSAISTLHTIIEFIRANIHDSMIFQDYYTQIISVLIRKLDSLQPEDYKLRNILILTISELLLACPVAHAQILDYFEKYIYDKIYQLINIIMQSSYDQALALDDSICGAIILLECSLKNKKSFDTGILCTVFGEIFTLPEIMARGEAYIAMSKLLCHFSIHLKKFMPFIIRDIKSREVFVLKSALNLLSECAIFLESAFIEFVPVVIPALLSAISSQDTPLELKPSIISNIGDIALAVGKGVSQYLGLCTILFTKINIISRVDDEEYVDELRRSCIKLFSCLFVSIGYTNEMRKELPEIMQNIISVIDQDVDAAYRLECVELIDDLIRLDDVVKRSFDFSRLVEFLKQVASSSDNLERTKAIEVIQQIYH